MQDRESQVLSTSDVGSIAPMAPSSNQIIDFLKSVYEEKTKEVRSLIL